MNFIIDAHLPQTITAYFVGQDMIHTSDLAEGNRTKDHIINRLSIKEQRIVITKDTDFYYSYLSAKKPYKLVLVKLGNMRIKDIKLYFKSNATKIIDLMETYSFIILEKNHIRVLE